ncbi:MAG: hypothetical protein H6729_17545 [Deltaproteobacteria bacterium]|nr:hypothetical protein [Deltaproteobacteria bacterium]
MKSKLTALVAVTIILWALFVAFNGLMASEVSYVLAFGLWLYALILGGASVGLLKQRRWAQIITAIACGLLILGGLSIAVAIADVRWIGATYAAIGAVQASLLYVAVRTT